MAKKSSPAPAALAIRNEVEPEDESQDTPEVDEGDEEVVIDPKREKALRAEGKLRDPDSNGKMPPGYKACVHCGRGIHIRKDACPLCDTPQPIKEPNPNAGTRGRKAAAPAPSFDEMFAILQATMAFANDYDNVDQAIDDIDSVLEFLDTVGGRDRAVSMLDKYRDVQNKSK